MTLCAVTPHVGVWIETFREICRLRIILSLPTWECGLKRRCTDKEKERGWSLPTWECGLKLDVYVGYPIAAKSLPTWECGLKPPGPFGRHRRTVTPHVGVWIETRQLAILSDKTRVTPHVGVWIETQ